MRDDALLDLAPHLVDLAQWLTGSDVRRVRSRVLTRQRAVFVLDLPPSTATVRCASNRMFSESVEARDDAGRVVAGYRQGGLVQALRDRLRPPTEPAMVVTLARQLEAFGRAVRSGNSAPLATATDGVIVMRTLDAVRRSAAKGGPWCAVAAAEPVR
jgi:predicted dehydrogenase